MKNYFIAYEATWSSGWSTRARWGWSTVESEKHPFTIIREKVEDAAKAFGCGTSDVRVTAFNELPTQPNDGTPAPLPENNK